jgi:endonuclease/exonuclease/phosphatase (EEP) superfamily protein YafD
MIRVLLRLVQILAWSLIGIGVVLHATVRDGVDPIIVVFYVLPMMVMLGLAALLCLFPRRRSLAILAAALIAATWCARSFSWHVPEPAAADEVRVLFWNLNRPTEPFKPLIGMIRELKPDFVACVEPGENAASNVEDYKAALPGYDCQFMPRGILWLSRHTSRYRARGRLDSLGAYAVFEAELAGRTQRFVTLDVYGPPLLSRRGQLAEGLGFSNQDPRVIVLGDFNTPTESVHFDAYRQQGLQDSLTVGGRGFRETWFYGLPLLSLDHIWLGKDWHVLEARKIWTRQSDHAAIFVRAR